MLPEILGYNAPKLKKKNTAKECYIVCFLVTGVPCFPFSMEEETGQNTTEEHPRTRRCLEPGCFFVTAT